MGGEMGNFSSFAWDHTLSSTGYKLPISPHFFLIEYSYLTRTHSRPIGGLSVLGNGN